MHKEFEGRTEQEAIDKAVEELGLDRDDFDVEILEKEKKGLFRKGNVRIRVYFGEDDSDIEEEPEEEEPEAEEAPENRDPEPQNDNERKIIEFVDTLIQKMGYKGKTSISFRRDTKIGLSIDSDDSSIIIGRKGKNLDAIQLITNVYAGNLDPDIKVVIDSENYRMRHEEQIIRNAYRIAEQVKRSGKSRLLDPMNPFERRLVHTALNDFDGVETKSEGEGLYKQVRIIPKK
ncbi:MAG: protein jag [Spirochaetes bacterium]|uniref:RNA-binding protein KhpB n=1 Tax=Candidatus Ornithospirochaeta stercoravium TaxID=2840897 RepID=A0A9D9IBG1_9SPIO|nr:protein jag [Candidatus Ornithospirochaeta stercoravium]